MYAKYEIVSVDVDGSSNAQMLYGGAKDLDLIQLGATIFF